MKKMKNFAGVLAVLCLAFVMTASLAGCGKSKDFASVQEYVDAQKEQIAAAIEKMEGSGMSVEITADQDALVYRYVYDDAVEVTEETTAIYEENLDTFNAQFEAVLDEMAEFIDVKKPEIRIIYENPDGSIVYTRTYTK